MDVSLTDIASRLRAADSALLVAHVNPDADALGSSLAVAVALEALGVDAQVSFPDDPFEVPLALRFLPRQDLIVAPEQAIPADLVMSMDASSGDRIGRLLAVGESAPAFIAVDHHASFVPFAPMVHADATRPATGLLALEIIDALGVDLTPDMALCLYAAISSDTGSFRFASTTPESMRAAARLMETGIDFAGAAKAMFDTKSRDFLRLQAEVMGDLEVLTAGGVAVAVIRVSRQDRDRHGIALVYDEIVTAMRTGEFLVAHHDPLARPDLVVLAKGLGAGYAPLGAVLTSAALADELADSTGFVVSHSYDANPIACAAGRAVLDEVVERDLMAHAAHLGDRVRAGLDALAADSPLIGDVRGRGLLLAIELVADRSTAAMFGVDVDPGAVLVRHGLDHGLLLYSRRQNGGRFGDWLLVAPPLVTDQATADEIVPRLGDTLRAATPELLS